jgi:DNA repair exonuclease SbcCD ATPase subunit
MNNLKALLKRLEEKRERLSSHQTFILYYDTAELEFVKNWRDKRSVYKEEELQNVHGLLERLKRLTGEATAMLMEIETFQKIAPARSREPQESSINDFIGRISEVTAKIETLSADCDVVLRKLPGELALGTP